MKHNLTVEYVLSRLDFNEDAGRFTWKLREVSDQRDKTWNTRYAGKEAGTANKVSGYRMINLDKIMLYEHALVWFIVHGEWPKSKIDHRSTDRLDNRPSNLRLASDTQNMHNTTPRIGCKSVYKGVSKNEKRGKWVAYITVNGKRKTLGYFTDEVDAAKCYDKHALASFGEFANVNFKEIG